MKIDNRLFPASLALGFVLAGCGGRQPAALEPDELPQYAFRLPADYDPQEPYPLLVVLHSDGKDENEPLALWDQGAFVEPDFILLAIRAPFHADGGYAWFRPDGDSAERQAAALTGEALVMDMVSDFEQQFNIDSDWRFLAGFSDAGNVALYTVFKHADIFQGSAALAGTVDAAVVQRKLLRNLEDMDVFMAPEPDEAGARKDSSLFDRAGARVMLYHQAASGVAADACRAMQDFFGLIDTASGPGE
jgi:predicted esterase